MPIADSKVEENKVINSNLTVLHYNSYAFYLHDRHNLVLKYLSHKNVHVFYVINMHINA